MTTPEVKTIKRDGSRFYVDPVSGVKVPSVTSIVGNLPKRALQFWRGKMVSPSRSAAARHPCLCSLRLRLLPLRLSVDDLRM